MTGAPDIVARADPGALTEAAARAILVTGKGGVGKTTIESRIAYGLAARRLPVHLSTTDPAGQLPGAADLPPA